MSDLRALATGSQLLNLNALRYLASLPRLRKLQCPNTSKDILESVQKLPSAAFPELQQLTLRETDFPSFIELMNRLKLSQLRDLTLFTQPRAIPSADHIHATFSALENTIQHSSLHRVMLQHIWKASRIRHRRVEFREDIVVTGSIMEPLFSFCNLTIVELNVSCAFDIGDGQVKAMAEAWPRLRRLQLGTLAGWHIPPSVTFTGLLSLTRKCRELEHLVLSLDGSSDFIPPRSSLTPADVNEKITYLYVGNGRMTDADAKRVSQFLLHVFPRLCGIGGEWLYHGHQTYQQEWERVVGYLKDVDNGAYHHTRT